MIDISSADPSNIFYNSVVVDTTLDDTGDSTSNTSSFKSATSLVD